MTGKLIALRDLLSDITALQSMVDAVTPTKAEAEARIFYRRADTMTRPYWVLDVARNANKQIGGWPPTYVVDTVLTVWFMDDRGDGETDSQALAAFAVKMEAIEAGVRALAGGDDAIMLGDFDRVMGPALASDILGAKGDMGLVAKWRVQA